MPVDPIGLAVGLSAVALAFKGVVDTANLFNLVVSSDNGSRHLALKYYIERHKTTIWGDEFRPDDEWNSPLLMESSATRRLIAGVLAEMLATHDRAEKILRRLHVGAKEPVAVPKVDQSDAIGIDSPYVKAVRESRDAESQKNRFMWAMKDKERFTELVDRMSSLNEDLRGLVRRQESTSLAAAISSSLLPMITNHISLVALQETDSVEPLLKISARLKELQNALEHDASPTAAILELHAVLTADTEQHGSKILTGKFRYNDKESQRAWVEWVALPQDQSVGFRKTVISRIQCLSAMLAIARNPAYRIPPFISLVKDSEESSTGGADKIGFVFSAPDNETIPWSGPVSLLSRIATARDPSPLLNKRFELAQKLASAVWLIHAAQWIHKSIRSENILFFANAEGNIDIGSPWITGFDYSRPETQTSLRDRVKGVPEIDIYYHPDVPFQGFNRIRDIYSLGVTLLEIAIWTPLPRFIQRNTGKQLDNLTMSETRSFLVSTLPTIGGLFGESYMLAVKCCLTGDFGEKGEIDESNFGRVFFTQVVQRLDCCRA